MRRLVLMWPLKWILTNLPENTLHFLLFRNFLFVHINTNYIKLLWYIYMYRITGNEATSSEIWKYSFFWPLEQESKNTIIVYKLCENIDHNMYERRKKKESHWMNRDVLLWLLNGRKSHDHKWMVIWLYHIASKIKKRNLA